MGTAAKFWPRALFGLGGKKDAPPNFTPTTELAARIVGAPAVKPIMPTPLAAVTSLDDLDFRSPAEPASTTFDEEDISRQAVRFVPDKTATTLTDTRGKSIRARIINVSATGVAVEADFRSFPVDTVAMVGAKPVAPGRAIRGGQVFIFEKPLDAARCNKTIVI